MNISAGKIIKIRKGGVDVLDGYSPMTLDNEISISFRSDFDKVVGDSAGKVLTLVSGATQAMGIGSATGKFKEMGYKVWTGTSPVEFSFNTTFNMKTNAFNDVMKPASELIKICLPSEGEFENREIGLVAPGPSLLAVFSNGQTANKDNYSIRIGAFYLPQIIIESVEPSYSTDVDEDGYPIWCTLKIDVFSLFTATTKLIDGFNYNIES